MPTLPGEREGAVVSGRRNRPKHPAKKARFGKPTRKLTRPAKAKCGKVGYRDKQEALWWLGRLVGAKVRLDSKVPLEQRVYLCNLCPGEVWHTTSQAQRTG